MASFAFNCDILYELSLNLNVYKSFMKMKANEQEDKEGYLWISIGYICQRDGSKIFSELFRTSFQVPSCFSCWRVYPLRSYPLSIFFLFSITGDKIDCLCNWHNGSFPAARQGTFNNYDYWHQWTASGELLFNLLFLTLLLHHSLFICTSKWTVL